MNIKKQIRAEIERLIRMNQTKNGFPAGTNCAIRIETYERLISFLDSLSEQPAEGLEEEVKKYWNAHNLDYRIGRVADLDFIFLCARHFAEWGRKQVLQEIYEGKIKQFEKILLHGLLINQKTRRTSK